MKLQQLQRTITTNKYAFAVALSVSVVFWAVTLFLLPDLPEKEGSRSVWQMICDSCFPAWAERLVCLLLYSLTGYYLLAFNNRFGLLRLRAGTHASLFCLLLAVWPGSYFLYGGETGAFFFLIGIYFLFDSYQQYQSSGHLFYSALFVGIGSLFYSQLTYFLPILLIGSYMFRSLNMRSFFALLVGWSVPYWFLLGYAFPAHQMELFCRPFIELVNFRAIDYGCFQIWEVVTLGYVFILCLVSSIHSFVTSYRDKIRTRVYLRFFMMLVIYIFLLIVLQPMQCMSLLPLLLASTGILTAHLFVFSDSETSAVFFVSVMIALPALFCFNIWVLLSNFSLSGVM